MRASFRSIVVAGSLFLAVSTATSLNAQTPIRVVYTKAAFGVTISRSALTFTDTSFHQLSHSFRIDRGTTDRTDFVIEEEHVWGQGETRGTVARSHGYAVYHMRGGDQVFIRWVTDTLATGRRADGETATGSGTIEIYGGTGRFTRVRGQGIYRIYRSGAVREENLLDVVLP
jgi:hypothetical protein